MEINISSPRSPYLVFTSAGRWANIEQWITKDRQWDLFLCNYGKQRHPQAAHADYYCDRQGGKFPNLYHAWQENPELFRQYDAVLVLDDDVIFPDENIHTLFHYLKKYQLWCLQPAFSPAGKISHRLTGVRSLRKLTYTNFVEVCAPLIRTDKLEAFFQVYDPKLVGWGVDLWLMHFLQYPKNKVAVIHDVVCINPEDEIKGGSREIERLQCQQKRIECWNTVKREHNIPDQPLKEFCTVWHMPTPVNIWRALVIFFERKYLRHWGKNSRRARTRTGLA
ncbi:hypothetical protein WKI13_05590 [Teredinibacter turnerae]|uniref:hypothetical protein n=1 Tax=Teredinibacter turnerae TaxID=2426 RepID=UPI00035CF5B2|nr:hypothetical protein [Teredinibacter turnerae]